MEGSEATFASDFLMTSKVLGALFCARKHFEQTGKPLHILVVMDECNAHRLFGSAIARYAVECLAWGVELVVIYQHFPQEPENVTLLLQNCARQEYYRQGDYRSAVIAAQQLYTLLLDTKKVKHKELRERIIIRV
jgi:hypothetical protein